MSQPQPRADHHEKKEAKKPSKNNQGLPPDIPPRKGADLRNDLHWRYGRKSLSDHFAAAAVKGLRFVADTFFKNRHAHRAVVLETVAAVPGMVGSMHNHLLSLRRMKHDNGLVRTLMEEAENERMHLMTFAEVAKPSLLERLMITTTQVAFLGFFSMAYMFNKRAAHRFIGLLEEEAVESYTHYLEAIDNGTVENCDAPKIAKEYWQLPEDAKLRDVVIAVRADEAEHRDVNHGCADKLETVIAERKAEKQRKKAERKSGLAKIEKKAYATLKAAQKLSPKV